MEANVEPLSPTQDRHSPTQDRHRTVYTPVCKSKQLETSLMFIAGKWISALQYINEIPHTSKWRFMKYALKCTTNLGVKKAGYRGKTG